MRLKILAIIALVAAAICSCGRGPMPEDQRYPIVRLDKALAEYKYLDSAQQAIVADSLAPEIDAMFSVMGREMPDGTTLEWWSNSQAVEMFQPVVDSVYPTLDRLEATLGAIIVAAQRDSLMIPDLRYAAVVWGRPQPLVRVDSVMLIALNHYLGADFEGYTHWEEYRRKDKTPEQLPYDLAAAIVATQYPFAPDDAPTLLNWMLYEGALMEARMRLVPDADLAQALAYTPEQLKFARENLPRLWEEMAIRKLIYSTDPTDIDRLLAPSPSSPLLGGQAPGRIGRYIGYQIVRAYLASHPDATLYDLLQPAFYNNQRTLSASQFKP